VSQSTRRYRRYRVQVPLRLRVGGRWRELVTEDVNYRGLFARSDEPVPLRQLLALEMELPPDQVAFRCHGMAVHRIAPPGTDEGHAPGVGLMFYALDSASKNQWEKFIAHIALTAPEIEVPVRMAAVDAPDPVRRAYPRYQVRLEVRPRSLDELLTMYSRDISKGGAFLETRQRLELGLAFEMAIVHPDLERFFALEAVVRRHGDGGIGVEFLNMNEARRAEFFEFVCSSGLIIDPADFD
jgi:hypothetical protein